MNGLFSRLHSCLSRRAPGAAQATLCVLIIAFSATAFTQASKQRGEVQIQVQRVRFRVGSGAVLEMRSLRGALVPTVDGKPVNFDQRTSFAVAVSVGEIAIDVHSLEVLLNQYLNHLPSSPIHDLHLRLQGDRLIEKGRVRKGIGLPFETETTLAASAAGKIELHAQKIKLGVLPVKGLLHLFGQDLADLAPLRSNGGIEISGDTVLIDPGILVPAPQLRGKVVAVTVRGGKIVQRFDDGQHLPALAPPRFAASYVYHRGSVLRFGKLTMDDTDLELLPKHPERPFEFNLERYTDQLVAGYILNTRERGLLVFLPSYPEVASRRRS